jgi:hypothetical protein
MVQVSGHRVPNPNQCRPSRVPGRVGLTLHSRRGPTSKNRACTVGVRIFHSAGPVFRCRPRLNSNVRHTRMTAAVRQLPSRPWASNSKREFLVTFAIGQPVLSTFVAVSLSRAERSCFRCKAAAGARTFVCHRTRVVELHQGVHESARRRLDSSRQHRSAMPNPSVKRSANSVAHWSPSAGPAAHFALAAQRATLSATAYLKR